MLFAIEATPVVTVRGKPSLVQYQAVIEDRGGVKRFRMNQLLANGIGPAGSWDVATLIGVGGYGHPFQVGDRLAIDFGQEWYIENMRALLAEALARILGVKT